MGMWWQFSGDKMVSHKACGGCCSNSLSKVAIGHGNVFLMGLYMCVNHMEFSTNLRLPLPNPKKIKA
jgi:hypothetical protein